MLLSLWYLLEVHECPTVIFETISIFRIIKKKSKLAQIICMSILYPRIALILVPTFVFGFTITQMLNNMTPIDMANEKRPEAM